MQIDDVQSSWEYCLAVGAVGHILPRSKDRLKYHQDSISMHQSQQITQIKKFHGLKKRIVHDERMNETRYKTKRMIGTLWSRDD